MDQIDKKLKEYLSVLDNEYVSASLSLFLVLYAGMAAPKLPERIARLFENTLFRILIFFLIAYSAKKNTSIAAIAAIGLMVSLQTLNRYDLNNSLKSVLKSTSLENGEGAEAENAEGESEGMEFVPQFPAPTAMSSAEPEGIMESDLSDFNDSEQPMEEIEENLSVCGSGGCNVRQDLMQTSSENAHLEKREQQELSGYDGPGSGFAPV